MQGVRRKLRYEVPHGPVAMPSKAWGQDFEVLLFGVDEAPRPPFVEEGRYAVVEICGPLSQKPGWWTDSYPEICSRVTAALASSREAVCLRIDSPGGDYAGGLECARDLRAMAAAAGKKLVAFTDGLALSAGYALACAASEIVTTESASVGSIGVWAPLIDVTAQDMMYGVKIAVVASGKAKIDRNPHVGITDEAFARLQSQIDDMAANFFALVAESRPGVSVEKIRALDGAEFFGSRGLAAGLSDRLVNSWAAFLSGSTAPAAAGKGTSMSKYDEAMGAPKRCAEGDDEDAKKAKKALKALEDTEKPKGEEPTEEKPKGEGEEPPKEKEGDEKKDGEEAKALAIKLSGQVAELTAKLDARDKADADAKASAALSAFWATRPDVTADQRASLDGLPLEKVKAIVATWPRVRAAPGSSAAATTPTVSGGEKAPGAAGQRPMTTEEQAVFDRTDPFRRNKTSAKASVEGHEFTMPARIVSNEESAARVAELEKELGIR